MAYSLAIDALLILMILLLVPIGMYRGGVREVCVSAGLLLGLQVAQLWSARWGEWLASVVGMDEGVAQFLVAMTTILLITGLVGYGAASAFSSRPGPGSRIFGGLIALANGVVFLGALIQFVILYLYDDERPASIGDSLVARALSSGFDWVVLVVVVCALVAILLGMIVRERETGDEYPDLESASLPTTRVPVRTNVDSMPSTKTTTSSGEHSEDAAPAAAVKVKEVRHWEEPAPQTLEDLQRGWSRTWPSTVTESNPSTSPRTRATGTPSYPARRAEPTDQELLETWLNEDASRPPGRKSRGRPTVDE